VLVDVCIVADCERAVKEVIDHYGQLDVLVSLFTQYFYTVHTVIKFSASGTYQLPA
jgi:hypothetical protein